MKTGEKIKQRRIELHWSQRDLADKMGYNHSTITRIETGKIGISQTRIIQFAKVLGVSLAYLMDDDYINEDDLEYIKSLGTIHPKEDLPPEVDAINTLLYNQGLQIMKTQGNYYFDTAGQLTDDEMQEFIDTIETMIYGAASVLINKKKKQQFEISKHESSSAN